MSKTTQNNIKWTCNNIRDLLLSKNRAYGDSALSPDNIFSKLDNAQAICARIDDKLSRIKNNGLDKNSIFIRNIIEEKQKRRIIFFKFCFWLYTYVYVLKQY